MKKQSRPITTMIRLRLPVRSASQPATGPATMRTEAEMPARKPIAAALIPSPASQTGQ